MQTITLLARLRVFATVCEESLELPGPSDAFWEVGHAAVRLVQHDPDAATALAHSMLHAHRFSDVPLRWRRCYEEAQLRAIAKSSGTTAAVARQTSLSDREHAELWLCHVTRRLDMALILTGAPGRRALIDRLLGTLASFDLGDVRPGARPAAPDPFPIGNPSDARPIDAAAARATLRACRGPRDVPPPRQLSRGVLRFPREARDGPELRRPATRLHDPSTFDFSLHWQQADAPAVLTGALHSWPALASWQCPDYWMQATLDGRRLVPVEVGSSYTDDDWGQKIMTFREFLQDHLLAADLRDPSGRIQPKVYLAQHDLLAQVPALRRDIAIPDYCWEAEPSRHGQAAVATRDVPPDDAMAGLPVAPASQTLPHARFQQQVAVPSTFEPEDQCGDGRVPSRVDDGDGPLEAAVSVTSFDSGSVGPTPATPAINIWLGPGGTVSPAHTDPHHNILAQVVGRKYVRLFAPSQGPKLFPMGGGKGEVVGASGDDGAELSTTSMPTRSAALENRKRKADDLDEADRVNASCPDLARRAERDNQQHKPEKDGQAPSETPAGPTGEDQPSINMSNTASVDVGLSVTWPSTAFGTEEEAIEFARTQKSRRAAQSRRCPLFEEAEFVETILEPGECLFIPRGWWHYITSLDVSCSVSFWWD